jgi:multisubunit Na+/H+ antiporter MnhB subunit
MDLTQVESSTAGTFIGNIIAWLLGITAVLAVLAVTYAGIQMILATWEEEKFKKARHTMIYAFVGLIVAGLAYETVKFVTRLNLDVFL